MPSVEELLSVPLSELTERYLDRARPVPHGLLEALEADTRQGARSLARRIRARQEKNRSEGQRLRHLLRYETELWTQGLERVVGVDEAGMAPLAGPVVAAGAAAARKRAVRPVPESSHSLATPVRRPPPRVRAPGAGGRHRR